MNTLKFNKKIYKKQAVAAALREFREAGCFQRAGEDKDYITVVWRKGMSKNSRIAIGEFSNFVLAATKQLS